jgi:hypothetical protein
MIVAWGAEGVLLLGYLFGAALLSEMCRYACLPCCGYIFAGFHSAA